MSEAYEEILEGAALKRLRPDRRHELICERLHKVVKASLTDVASTRLLEPRAAVWIAYDTTVCPDLALVTAATGKLWLAAEIISSDDHRTDTVLKKQIYEQIKLPRLWMIDPRYDNVEVYHGTEYGLMLKTMLAGREILTEKLLPQLQIEIAALFRPEQPHN